MQRTSNDLKNFRLLSKATKPRSKKIDKAISIRLVLNIIVVLFVLFPIIYAFVMSVKPSYELYNKTFFTANPSLENYKDVFKIAPIELSLIHISEPTRQCCTSRMPSSA